METALGDGVNHGLLSLFGPVSPSSRPPITPASIPVNFSNLETCHVHGSLRVFAYVPIPSFIFSVLHAPAHPSRPGANVPLAGRTLTTPTPRQNQYQNLPVPMAFSTLTNPSIF